MAINEPLNPQFLAQCPVQEGFRQRGHQMTRIEVFTDTAFAFAATMLVISLNDVPRSWTELAEALKQLPALIASFMTIMLFWYGHVKWSRRFGLENGATVWLSGAVIFVMLVFVFLLRLLFSSGFAWASSGWLPSEMQIQSIDEVRWLFLLYGSGFFLLSILLGTLNLYAFRLRGQLSLNALEMHDTRTEIVVYVILAATALLSMLFALIFDGAAIALAGFAYATLGISMPLVGVTRERQRSRYVNAGLEGEIENPA